MGVNVNDHDNQRYKQVVYGKYLPFVREMKIVITSRKTSLTLVSFSTKFKAKEIVGDNVLGVTHMEDFKKKNIMND